MMPYLGYFFTFVDKLLFLTNINIRDKRECILNYEQRYAYTFNFDEVDECTNLKYLFLDDGA